MATVNEIARDVFRISEFAAPINLEFSHFLVRDDEPLLFHTGLRGMFPAVLDAVKTLMDPARLRWISFSHFESDECGALNEWLGVAPHAEPACGLIGAEVNVRDFASRAPRVLMPDQTLATGRRRFRFLPTAHVPHGWDAGVLFDETDRVLFCSDLFHQWEVREPLTSASVLDRARDALVQTQASPFANYVPYTARTGEVLRELARVEPRTLAIMHGSSFQGDGASELRGLAEVMKDVLGPRS